MRRTQAVIFVGGGILATVGGEGLLSLARVHARLPFLPYREPVHWLPGAISLLLGLTLLAKPVAFSQGKREHTAYTGTRFWAALGLVLIVTAATRLYRIMEIPPGLWLDETDIAKQALEIVRGARPYPWHVARLEIPWLYHYYVAAFYAFLGPGYLTVKLPHLVVSILTGGSLYLLARELLDEPFALIAALLWATMRWSVNMSRWGHANAMALFWYVTVLWLLWRGMKQKRWGYWLAGGVALGLSQYSYQAARSLVLLVLLFLLYQGLHSRGKLHSARFQILAFFGLFILIYAPLGYTYVHQPRLFLARSEAISIFNPLFTRDPWITLKANVGKYLGMFFYVGDPNGRHNIPGWPVVDPVTGLLLVVGLARMIRAPARPRHVLLFLWIGAFLTAGILTTEAPNTFRVYGITPALALIAALGLSDLTTSFPSPRLLHKKGLPLFLLLVAAYLNLHAYFAIQADHPSVVGMFNVGPTKVGQYIATLPPDVTIYLDREFWAFSPIDVINPGRSLIRLKTPDHIPPPPKQRGAVVYILGRYGRFLLPYLQRLYPRARVATGYGPNHHFVYAAVQVSAKEIARRGLRVVSGSSAGQILFPEDVKDDPLILDGGLMLPRPGRYGLRVDGARELELGIGRELALTQPDMPVTLTLPAGLVPVHLTIAPRKGLSPHILWRPPGAHVWQKVPAERWYPLAVPPGGLLAQWYEGGGLRSRPVTLSHAPILYADNAGNLATSAMRWTGYIYIGRPGTYRFGLSSDDGSRLWIDGRLRVDNWGLHGPGWVDAPATLSRGWHPLRIDYIDNGGSHWFEWRWAPPGQRPGPVPPAVLAWDSAQVSQALTHPPEPQPGLPVFDAKGHPLGQVPIAVFQLRDPKFNRPVANANFQKWPLKLGTTMYDQGIGVYGPGELEFRLGGHYQLFRGKVGVDTDTYGDAHTQVQIIGDGRVLWDSGEIHPWDTPKTFRVDVKGVKILVLKQIEAGHFQGRGDGVDWVNVRLLLQEAP